MGFSVQDGLFPGWSVSRSSLSWRGLCLGGSLSRRRSLSGGPLPLGFLSRAVSVQKVCRLDRNPCTVKNRQYASRWKAFLFDLLFLDYHQLCNQFKNCFLVEFHCRLEVSLKMLPNIFLSIYFTEYDLLQTRVKSALERGYKDFLKHDWLEEGLSFSLMKYYTDLSWAKMVNKPMVKERVPMEGMDEILKVPGAGVVCVKILIEGEYLICLYVTYIS